MKHFSVLILAVALASSLESGAVVSMNDGDTSHGDTIGAPYHMSFEEFQKHSVNMREGISKSRRAAVDEFHAHVAESHALHRGALGESIEARSASLPIQTVKGFDEEKARLRKMQHQREDHPNLTESDEDDDGAMFQNSRNFYNHDDDTEGGSPDGAAVGMVEVHPIAQEDVVTMPSLDHRKKDIFKHIGERIPEKNPFSSHHTSAQSLEGHIPSPFGEAQQLIETGETARWRAGHVGMTKQVHDLDAEYFGDSAGSTQGDQLQDMGMVEVAPSTWSADGATPSTLHTKIDPKKRDIFENANQKAGQRNQRDPWDPAKQDKKRAAQWASTPSPY